VRRRSRIRLAKRGEKKKEEKRGKKLVSGTGFDVYDRRFNPKEGFNNQTIRIFFADYTGREQDGKGRGGGEKRGKRKCPAIVPATNLKLYRAAAPRP